MKYILLFVGTIFSGFTVFAQIDTVEVVKIPNYVKEVYQIKNKAFEIPLTAATTAWSLYGMSKIYGREKTPVAKILSLDKNNINSFDRSTWDNYDDKAKITSDMFFYGSMPLPLLLMLDKDIRKDGVKVGFLWLQAMGITGTLYTTSAMTVNRFRPYTYNPAVDMDTRTRGGGKNSFMAGHPALVATSTFFMAKVFTDYHPEMKNKWILFSVAGLAAGATGYFRVKAGQHFPTDVITGITTGTLSGILIPHFHKIKKGKEQRLTVVPMYNGGNTGFYATYKF